MFTPDRLPHPAVDEIKFLQQPVSIQPSFCNHNGQILLDVVSGRSARIALTFENRYSFRQLDHIEWTWTITTNRFPTVVRSAKFFVEANKRRGVINIQLDSGTISRIQSIARAGSHNNARFWINLIGSLKERCDWAPSGHQLVDFQYEVKIAAEIQGTSETRTFNQVPRPTFETTGDSILVYYQCQTGERSILATLNKSTGGLTSYSPLGRNVLEREMLPSFCRAFTGKILMLSQISCSQGQNFAEVEKLIQNV